MTDIWIAGLGVRGVNQVTREVEHALRSSLQVLYLDAGVAARPYLESLCPRVTSLFERSYAEDQPRVNAYEHMAICVIQAALENPPVTFAIHGHPIIAVHAPFLVLEMGKALDLRVEILPGISSLDTLFADLRLDPVVHGSQMYEATDLLLRRRPLQNDVPAIIWQIGPLETALHSQRISRPERFTRFIAHLRQFYPAQHQVVAIYCSPHPLMPPAILPFALEDMGQHAEQLHAGFTLYVPPAVGRPVQDVELLAKLYSVEHLRSISR
jgi:hypothetical protein